MQPVLCMRYLYCPCAACTAHALPVLPMCSLYCSCAHHTPPHAPARTFPPACTIHRHTPLPIPLLQHAPWLLRRRPPTGNSSRPRRSPSQAGKQSHDLWYRETVGWGQLGSVRVSSSSTQTMLISLSTCWMLFARLPSMKFQLRNVLTLCMGVWKLKLIVFTFTTFTETNGTVLFVLRNTITTLWKMKNMCCFTARNMTMTFVARNILNCFGVLI